MRLGNFCLPVGLVLTGSFLCYLVSENFMESPKSWVVVG